MRFAVLFMTLVGLTACNSVHFTPVAPVNEPSAVVPQPERPLCVEGETTWANGSATQVRCDEACWDGSYLQCEARQEKEMICSDNRIQETGRTRITFIGNPIGSCPVEPTPPPFVCNEGQTRWIAGGSGTAQCPSACWDGSFLRCQTSLEKQQICRDNSYRDNGQTRVASVGSPIGSCPLKPVYKDVTENFTAPGPGKADILVILDTTPSMDNDLNKLAPRLGKLTEHLKDVDWQVAVTNAGARDGEWFRSGHLNGKFMVFERDIVKKRTVLGPKESADYYFQYTVGRGKNEGGDRCEIQPYCMSRRPEPMAAIMAAIDQRGSKTNQGFFRKDAWLVPLIITDADENEYGDATATQPAEATGHFARQLGGHMKGLVAFGITIKPGDKACLDANNKGLLNGGAKYATLLNQFFALTEGKSMSLCDADYGPGLKEIGEAVREKMSFIEIKRVPATAKIEVVITPKTDATWKLQGHRIVFSKPLPANAKVQVRYQVKAD